MRAFTPHDFTLFRSYTGRGEAAQMPERPFPPRWLIVALTVLVIAGLLVPTLILILRSQD